MSNDTYASRLAMPVSTISQIKSIIKEDIKRTISTENYENKQCFHIVGPAGVGKTQIVFQIMEELNKELDVKFGIKKINAPVLTRDDFLIPYPTSDSKFKMLYSEFVPNENEEYGIFVIDECSRGDQQLQQMLWQIQNENQLHTYNFPKGWFIVTIDNPDDDNYQVNNMEDAAGLRRCLHLYTKVSSDDFLNYAKISSFHPYVVDYIDNYPDRLYDFESQKEGKIYPNPASWEKVSNHLWKYNDNNGIFENINIIEMLCGGLINIYNASQFCFYLKNLDKKIIKPQDIFQDYDSVREDIIKLVKEKKNNELYDILNGFIEYLIGNQPEPIHIYVKNTLHFLTDIPMDIAAGFVTHLSKLTLGSPEQLYFMSLLVAMNNESEEFKEKFFNKLLNLGG